MVCRILIFVHHVLYTIYHIPYTLYHVFCTIYCTIYHTTRILVFRWSVGAINGTDAAQLDRGRASASFGRGSGHKKLPAAASEDHRIYF